MKSSLMMEEPIFYKKIHSLNFH